MTSEDEDFFHPGEAIRNWVIASLIAWGVVFGVYKITHTCEFPPHGFKVYKTIKVNCGECHHGR